MELKNRNESEKRINKNKGGRERKEEDLRRKREKKGLERRE